MVIPADIVAIALQSDRNGLSCPGFWRDAPMAAQIWVLAPARHVSRRQSFEDPSGRCASGERGGRFS